MKLLVSALLAAAALSGCASYTYGYYPSGSEVYGPYTPWTLGPFSSSTYNPFSWPYSYGDTGVYAPYPYGSPQVAELEIDDEDEENEERAERELERREGRAS